MAGREILIERRWSHASVAGTLLLAEATLTEIEEPREEAATVPEMA